jgi:predicted DNA-binding transcriptional regulator AlpA
MVDQKFRLCPDPLMVGMLNLETPLEKLDEAGLTTLLGQVEALKFRILRRLDPAPAAPPAEQPATKLVGIREASDRIGKSKSWLYRNARTLPFTRRIGGSLRFDTRVIEVWLRARQAS